ncbi:MAG: PorP/SprF family type IX secretion system membrane protein [Crocinitomicaceae bacterium]
MTSIDKNNIEKWLFDYHEGNLNQEDRETLERFVLLNPEYESEMDAWSMAFVENEEFEYHNTESLYQKKKRFGWIGWSSAAAILVSGIVLSFLFLGKKSESNLANHLSSLSESNLNQNQNSLDNLKSITSPGMELESLPNEVTGKNGQPLNVQDNEENSSKNEISENGFAIPQVWTPTANEKRSNKNLQQFNTPNKVVHEPRLSNTNKSLQANPDLVPQNMHATADENVVVANSNLHAGQLNDSNGQNHAEIIDFSVNNQNTDVLVNNTIQDELISAIPGKNAQIVTNDEFAHLEPVSPHLQKDITLNQALDKLDYEDGKHNGAYLSNPEFSENKIDLSENLKNSSRKTTTKFIRDLKRAFNNPSGVTNLRNPNLVIPGYNPLAFNPSLAGGMLKTRIQTSYMNQWTGTSQMQHMAQLSVDGYVYGMRGGIGMNIQFKDYAQGTYRNYDAALMYSPKINFGKFLTIEPSIKFNMGAYTLDKSKIVPGGQIEMERGNVYQTFESGESPIGSQKMYYDLGVGLFVNTKWFYAGFSMDNVFRHKENIYSNDVSNPRRAPFRMNAVIGTDFESRNKNFSGSPYIVYQHFDNYDEFYFGSNFRFYWGTAGVSISDKGNISAQAGVQFKKFKMYYQYDWTKSKLMGIKGHSHEIMFRFTIKPKRSFTKNLEY